MVFCRPKHTRGTSEPFSIHIQVVASMMQNKQTYDTQCIRLVCLSWLCMSRDFVDVSIIFFRWLSIFVEEIPSMIPRYLIYDRGCVSDLLPDMMKPAFPAKSDLPPTFSLWIFFARINWKFDVMASVLLLSFWLSVHSYFMFMIKSHLFKNKDRLPKITFGVFLTNFSFAAKSLICCQHTCLRWRSTWLLKINL